MALQPVEKSLNNIPNGSVTWTMTHTALKTNTVPEKVTHTHPLCLASQAVEEDGGITVPVCKHSSLSILLDSCCLSYPLQKGVSCFVHRGEEHRHIPVVGSAPQH